MEALLIASLLVILVLVAVIVNQKPKLSPIRLVKNKRRGLNEPATYHYVRVLRNGSICDLMFTDVALEKAIYRASQNKEDFN